MNTKKFNKIITQMENLKKETDIDIEASHGNADDLLMEALETIAPKSRLVTKLIKAYNEVDKWYA